MSTVWQLAALTCGMLGGYYFIQAMRNLAPGHPESMPRILLWSKVFARRENFTALGWQYRNRSLVASLLMLAIIVIGGVLGLPWHARKSQHNQMQQPSSVSAQAHGARP